MSEHRGSRPGVEQARSQATETELGAREIELKIVNLGDPAKFLERVRALGGVLVKDRRLLHDEDFSLSRKRERVASEAAVVSVAEVQDLEKLRRALSLLRVEVVSEGEKEWVLKRPERMKRRMVRLRNDGGQLDFTVKQLRKKDAEIDNRAEEETGLLDDKGLRQWLIGFGYKADTVREKYRTTYHIGETVVDLNEGPVAPPWAEIEGPSEEEVFRMVELLGYEKKDTAAISDGDYYKSQGIDKARLKRMVFEEKT